MTDRPRSMTGLRQSSASALRQWLPVAVLVCFIAAAYFTGLHRYVSLATLAEHRETLRGFVHDNLLLALAAYALLYVVIVALSLPGAAVMSIAGGFLFGWMLSAPVTVVAATIGAVIVFEIVSTSFGAALAARAGPMVKRLSAGFAADAFHYLLFLRLAPVFPFFVVNAVAGLCRVKLSTFVIATVIGIIPASIAFALLGTGLDAVIEAQLAAHAACVAANGAENCSFSIDAGALVTRELLLAFAGLGLVALIPVVLRRFRKGAP